MQELQMNCEYKERPGLSHGPIMAGSVAFDLRILRQALEIGSALTPKFGDVD